MTRHTVPQLVQMIRDTPGAVILKAVAICDGHSIFGPQAFVDAGLPEPVVRYFTSNHRSDPASHKGTIFVGGRAVDHVTGVYGLSLLEFVAEALGVDYRRCHGRGSQSSAIHQALQHHLQPKPPVTAGAAGADRNDPSRTE